MQIEHRLGDEVKPGIIKEKGVYFIENDTKFLENIREIIEQRLGTSWNEDLVLGIKIALEEIITNAMIHGNLQIDSSGLKHTVLSRQFAERKQHYDQRVRLSINVLKTKVSFTVADLGPGIDISKLHKLRQDVLKYRTSKRGLALVHSLATKIIFWRDSNNRNCVTVWFELISNTKNSKDEQRIKTPAKIIVRKSYARQPKSI